MSEKPDNTCEFSGCWKRGELRNGSARTMVFCDDHASVADFSDERLNRWIDVAVHLYARFDLAHTLPRGEVRRFRVLRPANLGEEPILVRCSFESVTFPGFQPIIHFRIGQRPFPVIFSSRDTEARMPQIYIPWTVEENPGIYRAVEDGDFEDISEEDLYRMGIDSQF